MSPSLRLLIALVWAGSVGAVVGCSGKKPDAAPAPAAPAPSTPAVAAQPVTPAAVAPAAAPQPVDPNKPETKWIGTIPYDVFFDQPIVVASDATSVGGGAATPATPDVAMSKPAEGTTGETPAATPAAPAGSKPDWAQVISIDVALEAVKVARSEMNANLVGIPKYNAGMDTIRLNAALMGMMAIVISEHSEPSNLKDKAKYVRDLNYEILGKATEKGSGPYKATQELFEQIVSILDGGKPPEKPSDDTKPYVEVADRSDMMKIIDKAMNDLKANIGDPKRMKEQADSVSRQMAVMAALGTMMLDSTYEYADNPEYTGYTNDFINGAKAGLEAVKSDKFEEFQGALNKMNNSCNECHPKFRGQDNG
jgi:hypothetical protein